MPISFASIKPGTSYSRNALAKAWGYKSFHAIARGIVTPQSDNKIVIFITEEKQNSSRQYQDRLVGKILKCEGPDDHFAEERIAHAATNGEQLHLFYRKRHHTDFTYLGEIKLLKLVPGASSPTYFEYELP